MNIVCFYRNLWQGIGFAVSPKICQIFGLVSGLLLLIAAAEAPAATAGSVDLTFDPGVGADFHVTTVAIQGDGKLLVAGEFSKFNDINRRKVARLNADGSVDESFQSGGTGANDTVYALAVQADGKIIIGGRFSSFDGVSRSRIARLNSDGTLDEGFNPGSGASGNVYALAIQEDGRVVWGGMFSRINGVDRYRIARLHSDGSLDPSFDPGVGADRNVLAVAIQGDGKILIGGLFTKVNGVDRNGIARLNPDGSLDTNFDPGTGTDMAVTTIVLQDGGKILIGGSFTLVNGSSRNRIARLNANGSVDPNFDPETGANGDVISMGVQDDGKIVIGGFFNYFNGTTFNHIGRLQMDGSVDPDFDPGIGPGGAVLSIAIQNDGKLVIGGLFLIASGLIPRSLLRF